MTSQGEIEPVPLVERLAYVLREWEESHAGWAQPVINGSIVPPATDEAPEPEPYAKIKTECECSHCQDARAVLADYEARAGDAKAERIRY